MGASDERLVRVGDVDLWTSRRGGDGPTVLLLAGAAMSSRIWELGLGDVPRADGLSTIEMDWRDTGRSTWRRFRDHPNTFDRLVGDVAAVLESWAVERCGVVGYSMGGCVAQLLSIRHPDAVVAMGLIASGHASPIQVRPSRRQEQLWSVLGAQDATTDEALVSSLIDQWSVLHGSSASFDRTAWEPRIRDWIVWGYNPNCPHVKLRPQVFGVDRGRELEAIDVPTIVVHGDDDPMFPIEHGRALERTLPRARLVALQGRGHEIFSSPAAHHPITDHLTAHLEDR